MHGFKCDGYKLKGTSTVYSACIERAQESDKMLSRSASAKLQPSEWNCHCCTAKNTGDAVKCRVCGRPESYALQGYGLPFHGKNSTLFRPAQILTVMEDIHEVDSELWSALHSACAGGNFPVVKDLLALKAKFETTTNKGQTPLHLAVYSGSLDCVNELLKYGANPNISTIHEKCTPLHIACQKGFAQIAVTLVDHGARVDVLNVLSRTPLHMAAEAGRVDIGKYLLSRGADRDALDVHGWSCRQIAELFQHRDFQELMIREGMVEKQIIIKELPEAEWHSALWFDVTRMHAARKEELRIKNETTIENNALLASLQKSKKDEIIAQRRAERQLEIQEYHAQKNLVKEMALQYTEKLSVSRQPTRGKIKNLPTAGEFKPTTATAAIVPAISLPPPLSMHVDAEGDGVLRVNTAEKVRSPLPRSRVSTSETATATGYTRSRPVSRISFAGELAVFGDV